ncbi:CPBP family intramembrane metalloprotease [Temperatibacter marinus]|uniref:CPBP family intramembrane metalloprotease n=1 Tax=Temperatibacter marinus TaxID=1456591 RepID=A0AA52EIJ8_9PROT|nr:CPBP family intramembrane glutamic endopeptidase [Temperatibacter marinus]WND02954.1 CPBP family intramembrane metalloprotease [Temperatibacter marinus]
MVTFKQWVTRNPFLTSSLLTLASVFLLFLVKFALPQEGTLFNWPRLIVLNSISVAVVYLLARFDWLHVSGLMEPVNKWHPRWLLLPLPLLALALLSLTSAQLSLADYSPIRITAWLLSNFSTGFFEEVLLRGFAFLLLWKAWGQTKKGIYKAAFVQALVFGLAHLGNLYDMPVIDVMAQVVFSTLIGFGFAGLTYLTRSLWPAIIIHMLINCAGTFNDFFLSRPPEPFSPGIAGYAVIIVLFILFAALPGVVYLKRAKIRVSGS